VGLCQKTCENASGKRPCRLCHVRVDLFTHRCHAIQQRGVQRRAIFAVVEPAPQTNMNLKTKGDDFRRAGLTE
jgi:hypothetical protein